MTQHFERLADDVDGHDEELAPEAPARADLLVLLAPLMRNWRSLLAVVVLGAAVGTGIAFTMEPIFTASTMFLPPQPEQSGTSAALASLSSLAGLTGAGGGGTKSPTDQYVGLMGSITVQDRIIDKFSLRSVYDAKYRFQARDTLSKRTQFTIGKKDGLVTVSVDDTDPKRAAAIANQFIEELRKLTSVLAVSEAQRRRMFFEKQLDDAKNRLTAAQSALQASGFTEGALRAEPKTAADSYARLQAELTATTVTLQTMRQSLSESSPQIQQQLAKEQALREQIQAQEKSEQRSTDKGADYVGKYREFKYQETLFDLMARQYELARVDESREGVLIQIVDPATPPEYKSKPARLKIGLMSGCGAGLAYALLLIARARARAFASSAEGSRRWAEARAEIDRN